MSWLRFAPKEWTKAHRRLFHRLNREGIPFFSEEPVRGFKVDFLISPFLIAEVDGKSHLIESRRRKDAWKDQVLTEHGYTVKRFTDREVERELDRVVDDIKEAKK